MVFTLLGSEEASLNLLICWLVTLLLISSHALAAKKTRVAANYILDNHWMSQNQKGQAGAMLGALLLSSQTEIKSSVFTASLLGTHSSGSPTDFVGDLQVLSNIDVQGQEGLKVYELNYQWNASRTAWTVGWTDLSTTFNVLESIASLTHSSFGTSADLGNTGLYGPSIYPIPSFGLKGDWDMGAGYYLQAAVADPILQTSFRSRQIQSRIHLNANQHMAVIEAGRKESGSYALGVGAWNLNFEDPSIGDFHQAGIYTQMDLRLNPFLRPFYRQGFSTRVAQRIYANTSLGVRLLPDSSDYGLIEFGFSSARIDGVRRPEDVTEIIYQLSCASYFSYALSYQYISRPGGREGSANVATLRLRFDRDWTLPF